MAAKAGVPMRAAAPRRRGCSPSETLRISLRRLARLTSVLSAALAVSGAAAAPVPIDRHARVNRHQPVLLALGPRDGATMARGPLPPARARLGQPGRTVNALLLDTSKNAYRPNGHNHQRPGLPIYLPGNGGLREAVAMTAAGGDGAPDVDASGFPRDGSWKVRWENLRRMPWGRPRA